MSDKPKRMAIELLAELPDLIDSGTIGMDEAAVITCMQNLMTAGNSEAILKIHSSITLMIVGLGLTDEALLLADLVDEAIDEADYSTKH
jgi:hypothetical protein